MILPRPGDEYPMAGEHAEHVASIVDVDMHAEVAWDQILIPPTIVVRCSCGYGFTTDLVELVMSHGEHGSNAA